MRCDSETKECRDQSVRHGGIYEGPLHVDSDLRRSGNGMWIPRQRSASLSLLSSWDHTLFLSFLVSIQQQHTAADRGQGWPPLSVVHTELQEAVQSRQTPQTVPLPLHLQLRGERCTPAVALMFCTASLTKAFLPTKFLFCQTCFLGKNVFVQMLPNISLPANLGRLLDI